MYCQKCGEKMEEGVQFCTKCGAPMNAGGVRMSSMNVPLQPASAGRRLANFVLDYIGAIIFVSILDTITALLHVNPIVGVILSCVYVIGYYVFFEALWQATPAKWITGTKVVREDGEKPHFSQILGRSFSRLIPFEVFSFLFTSNPVGWHDRFPHTLVVSKKLTPEDVKNFNWVEIKKQKGSKVVVIIVCAFAFMIILGVFATVVLTSLGSARDKAENAHIKANLSMARANAEVYKDGHDDSYAGLCDSPDGLAQLIAAKPGSDMAPTYVCNDSDTAWALSVKLGGNEGYMCSDDINAPGEATGQLENGDTSCDGISLGGADMMDSH